MLPQSAQLGESALTLKETRVAAPREAANVLSPLPLPFPLPVCVPFPFPLPLCATTGRGEGSGRGGGTGRCRGGGLDVFL